MFRGSIPVLVLAACFAEEQHNNTTAYPVGGVSIPAELTSTIRAERVHRGDPVEFRTLEPVLIAKGLVMPANTKLTGRVVGAAPLENGKPSWLVLLVEHGEWKNQSVPLHAFIAAQITVSQLPAESQAAADAGTTPRDPRRAGRESGRVARLNGVDVSSNTHLPEDSPSAQSNGPSPMPEPATSRPMSIPLHGNRPNCIRRSQRHCVSAEISVFWCVGHIEHHFLCCKPRWRTVFAR